MRVTAYQCHTREWTKRANCFAAIWVGGCLVEQNSHLPAGLRDHIDGQQPGLYPSLLEFLFEHNAAILGSVFDEAPDQSYPLPLPAPVHLITNPYIGLPTLWNVNLKQLAEVCAEMGRWEFLFVIAPLVIVGGTGSVVNPIAVFQTPDADQSLSSGKLTDLLFDHDTVGTCQQLSVIPLLGEGEGSRDLAGFSFQTCQVCTPSFVRTNDPL